MLLLLVNLAGAPSLAFGQLVDIPREPMPVSNARAPSGSPSQVSSIPRLAQLGQPFAPSVSADVFSIPATPPPVSTLAPNNSGTGVFLPAPAPEQTFQPWGPSRPIVPGTNVPSGLDTPWVPPIPGPTGLPPASAVTPAENPTVGSTLTGPYGIPPQGFDPGYAPEVQVADLSVHLSPSTQSLNYFAGLGFNSDQGMFGRLSYDDRDFDWSAFPWRNPPVPFRGGGQRLRLEAMPGAQMQRYLVSFEQPFFAWFGGKPVSFNLSGHFFERDYYFWDERRRGGRFGFGYGINSALSMNTKFRVENVELTDPQTLVPELQQALGDHDLFAGALTLVYDTRDVAFAPSSGTYFEVGFEQVLGSFEYPRGTLDYRRYELLGQRPDRSGRHILGLAFRGAITGSDTPIYDNLFAGGYATLRGFRYRHASPKNSGVTVGGELSLTGSVEYYFPVTADDMIRGVLFSDVGSISEETSIGGDDLRASLGSGVRVYIPALGPAPLAIDVAVPIVRADADRIQNIHFYVNVGF